MGRDQTVIGERLLDDFRVAHLSPSALYEQIPSNDAILLINLPPGIGKSHAAQALAGHALDQNHDLVIYVAPTRALIDEMTLPPALPPGSVVVLEPRPKKRCGPLDESWADLERTGCAALAKATLCAQCPFHEVAAEGCTWPEQLGRIGPQTHLVVMTEKYLDLNPNLIQNLRRKTQAERVLMLFDEALFITEAMGRRFGRADLKRFRQTLDSTVFENDEPAHGAKQWSDLIGHMLDPEVELRNVGRLWTNQLRYGVLAIQRTGREAFGNQFRYLGSELELLNGRTSTGQWRDDDTFEITVRVDTTGCDVVVMAPYLVDEIVEERLHRPVVRLFSIDVFRHSGTRIINIKDPVGSARTLQHPDHFNRVVDFFTALILRNVQTDRRTVLVSRKKFLGPIKSRIEAITANLKRPITCILPGQSKSFDKLGPTEIPLINYGIVGVNSLQDFDALYCIGGYYTRS